MGEVILERKISDTCHVSLWTDAFSLGAGPQKGPEKILSVTLKSAKSSLLFNICNGGTCTLNKMCSFVYLKAFD